MKTQPLPPTPEELAEQVKEFDEVIKKPSNIPSRKVPVSDVIHYINENKDNLEVLKKILDSFGPSREDYTTQEMDYMCKVLEGYIMPLIKNKQV